MPHLSSGSSAPTRRLRPAAAGVSSGASSMLRLSRGAESRLPSGEALSGWVERAASMLDLTPMVVGEPLAAEPAGPAGRSASLVLRPRVGA